MRRQPGEADRASSELASGHWPARVGGVSVAALVAISCWAVASVSVWLIAPYGAVMIWLLFDPSRIDRHPGVARWLDRLRLGITPEAEPAAVEVPAEPVRSEWEVASPIVVDSAALAIPAIEQVAADSPTISEASAEEVEPAVVGTLEMAGEDGESSARPARKGRRGGEVRRARSGRTPVVPEPLNVTWVQVGPGKFVRVEAPATVSAEDSEDVDPAAEVERPEADAAPAIPVEPGSEPLPDSAKAGSDQADRGQEDRDASGLAPPESVAAAAPAEPEPESSLPVADDDERADALATSVGIEIPQAGEVHSITDTDDAPRAATAGPGVSEAIEGSLAEFDEDSALPFVAAEETIRPERPGSSRRGRFVIWCGRTASGRRSRRRRRYVARRTAFAGRLPSPRSASRHPSDRSHGRHTPRGPPGWVRLRPADEADGARVG